MVQPRWCPINFSWHLAHTPVQPRRCPINNFSWHLAQTPVQPRRCPINFVILKIPTRPAARAYMYVYIDSGYLDSSAVVFELWLASAPTGNLLLGWRTCCQNGENLRLSPGQHRSPQCTSTFKTHLPNRIILLHLLRAAGNS